MRWVLLLVLCLPTLVLAEDIRFWDCSPWQGTCPEVAEEPSASLPASVPPPPVDLFPPETLAPDTPPWFVTLFHAPTLENARLAHALQVERNQIIQQVQQLYYQAVREAKERGQ